jgi:hypothetical protein
MKKIDNFSGRNPTFALEFVCRPEIIMRQDEHSGQFSTLSGKSKCVYRFRRTFAVAYSPTPQGICRMTDSVLETRRISHVWR